MQSHVPQHAELQWLLTTLTPIGELERMTQFKDKAQRFESVPAGLLCYPILMAADILLYRADLVPVGDDQTQHLELTREIARKWNAEFGPGEDYFPEPRPLLTEAKRIMGLDGQAKMSKSLGNTIGIMDSPAEIWAKLRPAMTDPARVTQEGSRQLPRSATSTVSTSISRRRRRWRWLRRIAAVPSGDASTASACWPII